MIEYILIKIINMREVQKIILFKIYILIPEEYLYNSYKF